MHLAECFSPDTLVDLALTHFNLSKAKVDSIEYDSRCAAAFKKAILDCYKNKRPAHEGNNVREVNHLISLF